MNQYLVFLPCSIQERKRGILRGVVKNNKPAENEATITSYFILSVEPQSSPDPDPKKCNGAGVLGYSQDLNDLARLRLFSPDNKRDGFEIQYCDDGFQVFSARPRVKQEPLKSVVLIIYDDKVFQHSELLLQVTEKGAESCDHFQVLANLLQKPLDREASKIFQPFCAVWTVLLFLTNLLLIMVSKAKPVLKYSTLWVRLHGFLRSVVWALESLKCQRKVSLKVGNFVSSTAVDVCAGIVLLHCMDYIGITGPLSDYLLRIAKEVVHSLHHLLQWLSGSPAGLKLNGPFNLMMGRFFMYHIKLWWIFLSVAQPVLDLLFTIFLFLGKLGVTFQAAILADLLFMVSFHMYCIYVYAARVYYLQLLGLRALWRLFLGRKHNPLRERVDSCEYSPDQLFVGTLAFTILLFLLPTTLMYYVVFTTMRLILLSLSGLLTQACFIFHALPIFSTIHWIFRSNNICKSVYVTPKMGSKCGSVVLFVTPVADSWWNTVKCTMPDTVSQPPVVNFGQLVHKLLVGELVYPV